MESKPIAYHIDQDYRSVTDCPFGIKNCFTKKTAKIGTFYCVKCEHFDLENSREGIVYCYNNGGNIEGKK